MKCIRTLNNCPPGLENYLNCEDDGAHWQGFRDHNASASYKELMETLSKFQHGLCGYCEIKLTELNRQIEHVIPQSDPQHGPAKSLDVTNMIACCKGGSFSDWSGDEDRYREPAKKNLSCGQKKDDSINADFVDPRKLPALPSLMKVRPNGEIRVNANECSSAGIAPERVTDTIEVLGLNVERLRWAREKRWKALKNSWNSHWDDLDLMNAAARVELLPDGEKDLLKFFTTTRSYFGPLAERVLEQQPQEWI